MWVGKVGKVKVVEGRKYELLFSWSRSSNNALPGGRVRVTDLRD